MDKHEYEDVLNAVREERRRRGVTMRELADLAGMPLNTVERALTGYNDPSYSRVVKLADALGLRITVTGKYSPVEVAA